MQGIILLDALVVGEVMVILVEEFLQDMLRTMVEICLKL